MDSVDVLMVGHFAKDELIVDGKGETASGGGVYYGSVVLRRMGLEVAIVTRLHPRDFPRLEELKQAGVRVYATPAPETSGIANYYHSSDMERRVCKPIGFAGKIEPAQIPEIGARVIMVVPIIAGEVDLPLLEMLSARGPLALDVQGFVRVLQADDLVFKPWEEMATGLRLVTYLKVDRAEAEHLTGQTNLRAAARQLAAYGPQEIMVTETRGPTVYASGEFYHAPFTSHSLAGRTGRGDTCFSAYIGKRLSAEPQEATCWAAAVTSLKQEKPGPWQGPLEEAESLIREQA